jgi:hypothetical protein
MAEVGEAADAEKGTNPGREVAGCLLRSVFIRLMPNESFECFLPFLKSQPIL